MDRARDELLAGAALAGDQHGQIVALQPLNLLDDAGHRGAGGEESRQQRLERADRRRARRARSTDRAPRTSANPCRATAAIMRSRRITGWPIGRGEATSTKRGPSGSRPSGSTHERRRGRTACRAAPPAPARAPRRRRTRRRRSTRTSPPGSCDEDDGAVGGRRFEQRGGRLASQQIGQRRRIHDPPHDRIVGVGGRDDVFAGADRRQQRCAARVSARSRSAPSCSKMPRALFRWRSATDRAPVSATSRPSARWLSAAW